jgi:hypothetical protein
MLLNAQFNFKRTCNCILKYYLSQYYAIHIYIYIYIYIYKFFQINLKKNFIHM